MAFLLFYLLIGAFEGFKSAARTGYKSLVFIMPYVFANIHFSYGVGYLHGLYKVLLHKEFGVKVNR